MNRLNSNLLTEKSSGQILVFKLLFHRSLRLNYIYNFSDSEIDEFKRLFYEYYDIKELNDELN